jgi:hypothetical protein
MADWYLSTAAHMAIPIWVANTAYTVGQFLRPTTLSSFQQNRGAWRCTTAGTTGATEPNFNGSPGPNDVVASGTANFTNVTGVGTYGWSAAAYDIMSLSPSNYNRVVAGDRVFVSSDHNEAYVGTPQLLWGTNNGFGNARFISVNRAGSVPPVAADELAGAYMSTTSTLTYDNWINAFYQGMTFEHIGGNIYFGANGSKTNYFKNCSIYPSVNAATKFLNNGACGLVLENTTLRFGNTGQGFGIGSYPWDITWLDTPSAIAGSNIPTSLFTENNGTGYSTVNLRGVDLSALNTTLFTPYPSGINNFSKILLTDCKINSAVVRFATPGNTGSPNSEVELINCHDGTNIINERHNCAGAVTTERTTVLTGGPTDAQGAFSLKLVSTTRSDIIDHPVASFWLDIENSIIGVSRTATVEITGAVALNTDEIRMAVQYLGTAGSARTSIVDTWRAIVAVAAHPTSSVTWTSGAATKQYLRVTFTPQVAGRVRARVYLGKISTTVYVNPQIALA